MKDRTVRQVVLIFLSLGLALQGLVTPGAQQHPAQAVPPVVRQPPEARLPEPRQPEALPPEVRLPEVRDTPPPVEPSPVVRPPREPVRALPEEESLAAETLRDLERELEQVYRRLALVEQQLKEAVVLHRRAEDRALRYKATLLKSEGGLLQELDTQQRVLEALPVERLLQVGATFSPEGSLGALGMVALPGTPLSVISGLDYHVRDKELTTRFGVMVGLFSQRTLVEPWVRSRPPRIPGKARLTPEELQAIRARQEPDREPSR
ncbi:hypothetical protein AU468_11490 [Alkalispirochaeta sphaeroplastigenens]|uniref:Uncharacterized protein n=1 Tax=Alkalispirochaeta sphaeroplastigenens TaxID=1187066 RepID=A0A2S4JHI0_9SPIO|nr:hypothetical protein [Alkalispirochaeta sphaeroplastigenens]POQ99004.1 hypothetical protein AU468_11490 [Alkalispirochaeta sphaeroplastigenens]